MRISWLLILGIFLLHSSTALLTEADIKKLKKVSANEESVVKVGNYSVQLYHKLLVEMVNAFNKHLISRNLSSSHCMQQCAPYDLNCRSGCLPHLDKHYKLINERVNSSTVSYRNMKFKRRLNIRKLKKNMNEYGRKRKETYKKKRRRTSTRHRREVSLDANEFLKQSKSSYTLKSTKSETFVGTLTNMLRNIYSIVTGTKIRNIKEIEENADQLKELSLTDRVERRLRDETPSDAKIRQKSADAPDVAESPDNSHGGVLSPRFLPLNPQIRNNPVLSPEVMPLYSDPPDDAILPLGNDSNIIDSNDVNRLMELVLEASGSNKGVDRSLRAFSSKEYSGIAKEIARATRRFDRVLESLQGSFTAQQREQLETRQFTMLTPKQAKDLYRRKPIFRTLNTTFLDKYETMSPFEREKLLHAELRKFGRSTSIRSKRQTEETPESPLEGLYNLKESFILEANYVISPDVNVLSPFMFSPSVGVVSVIGAMVASPHMFSPLIYSPLVLDPFILTPQMLTSYILSPLLLSPEILQATLLKAYILTPMVLSPMILAFQVLAPKILTPEVLSPNILIGNVFSPEILSPVVLNPSLLIHNFHSDVILSPSVLS